MTTVSAIETDERRGARAVFGVVAVGFPLSAEQRQTVVQAMGPGCEIEDIRQAPADAAVVLVSPCSPQALQALQALFPVADIVVVDQAGVPDPDAARRAIGAGARDYLTISGLVELGRQLAERIAAPWRSAVTSAA
jgi:hypothetical protein